MTETILVYDIRRMLKDRQGSRTQRELAAEIGIHETHLSRVMNEHDDPGPTILKFLGLEKIGSINQYRAV
jgi:DNA-binding Xre family transcriptional regulator